MQCTLAYHTAPGEGAGWCCRATVPGRHRHVRADERAVRHRADAITALIGRLSRCRGRYPLLVTLTTPTKRALRGCRRRTG